MHLLQAARTNLAPTRLPLHLIKTAQHYWSIRPVQPSSDISLFFFFEKTKTNQVAAAPELMQQDTRAPPPRRTATTTSSARACSTQLQPARARQTRPKNAVGSMERGEKASSVVTRPAPGIYTDPPRSRSRAPHQEQEPSALVRSPSPASADDDSGSASCFCPPSLRARHLLTRVPSHGAVAVLREGAHEQGRVDQGGGRAPGGVHPGTRGRVLALAAQGRGAAALRQELQAAVDELPPARPQARELHRRGGRAHHPPARLPRQQVRNHISARFVSIILRIVPAFADVNGWFLLPGGP
jgi:hypothetical protein